MFGKEAGQEIGIGNWTLSPELAVHFADRAQTLVYGLSTGRGFSS